MALERLLRYGTLVLLDLNNNRMGDRACAILLGAIQASRPVPSVLSVCC